MQLYEETNMYTNNFVYHQIYYRNFTPVTPGYVLGILLPKGGLYDGPQDPRIFQINGNIYAIYNGCVKRNLADGYKAHAMFLWDFEHN
jgi:hypothetical protein